MDPNVQTAIATVITAAISTLGIVLVAMINTRSKNSKAEKEEESKEDESETLELLRALVLENARKEATIVRQRKEIEKLKARPASKGETDDAS